MKKKVLFIFSLFFIGIICVKAQTDTPFKKKYFKNRKDGFKIANHQLDLGNNLYILGMFSKALPYLLNAQRFNPNYSILNYEIGRCYIMNGSSFRAKSLSYFQASYQLNPNVAPNIFFYLGWAEQLNYKFDSAIVNFKKHLTNLPPADKTDISKTQKHITECGYGKEYVKKPDRVFIDNIGKAINTIYPEYGVIINADESLMMFTSRRPSSTGGKKEEQTNQYYEDVYYSVKKDGIWQPAENIGPPINTEGHDATVAVSPDGQRLIIYRDENSNGNLWESKLEGTTWSEPKRMKNTINTQYHESSASYSPDGKMLYFVSDRPGGMGGKDIWKSAWNDKKEKWEKAVNLGPAINTKYDEESVFMHPDGKTLYFSSQGHNGMGGYDIFKSTNENGKWTTPVNLGYPINTPDDDVSFVLGASGRRGYYSSIKKGGFGEKDIYVITFLGPEKPDVLTSGDNLIASDAKPVKEVVKAQFIPITNKNRLTLLKGFIMEYGTLKPIKAKIELINLEDNSVIATFNSNAATGKYLVALPSGKNYGIIITAGGHLLYSSHLNIPDSAAYKLDIKNIKLPTIEAGSKAILSNIFYDYNKSTLRKESTSELDHVIIMLQLNPTLKIELSAYTDQRGSDSYNLNLSQERAQSCVDYLTQHGIAGNRLVAKGYGEANPINSQAKIDKVKTQDQQELLYQQNRRTEIKVIAK